VGYVIKINTKYIMKIDKAHILKASIVLILLFIRFSAFSQVQVQGVSDNSINMQNPFLDASSFFDQSLISNSSAKGLVFPRADLTTWEFVTDNLYSGSPYFPSFFDGMIVYNTSVGNTPTSGNNPTESTYVRPGYYIFSNPDGQSSGSIAAGKWVRLNDSQVTNLPAGVTTPAIASSRAGDVFYSTTQGLMVFSGTAWVAVSQGSISHDSSLSGDGSSGSPLGLADGAVTSVKMAKMGASLGQVLTFNGTNWAPAPASNAGVTSFSGGTTGLTPVSSSTGAVTLGGTLDIANGGTGANAAFTARANLGAAANGNNSDITSLSGLTTPIPVTGGGTGATDFTPSGILLGNGTNEIRALRPGDNGYVLTSTGVDTDPVWASLPSSLVPLNKLVAATDGNTIDNVTFEQTWNWNSADIQSPLTLGASILTSGNLLTLTGGSDLTSGSLLNASGAVSASTTKGLINISNTAASSMGTVATIQANSTAGSGVAVLANGNVGIGTATPASTLEVAGAAINSAPTDLATNTIDFSTNNLAYTSYETANPAFILNNLKNGGAYTLVLTGINNSGTASFSASGFTAKYMGVGTLTSSKMHIFSLMAIGNYLFVTMATEN
jgi:hypothetical protein